MLKRPASPADLPATVPVFPLAGALLLPFSHRPLNIFEPRYIDMVDHALAGDRLIGLIQPEDTSEESPRGKAPLQKVGCLGRLTHFEENGEGRYFIILEGVTRFEAVQEVTMLKMMKDYAEFANFELNWDEIKKTGTADLVNFCCMVSPYGAAEKQVLLEANSLEDRAETLIALAEFEMAKGGNTAAPLN